MKAQIPASLSALDVVICFKKGAKEYTLKRLCETKGYGVVQELDALSGRDGDVIFQHGSNESNLMLLA